MADENFGIVVEIDPRPALAGSAQVDRALEKNEQSARDFEREAKAAMAEVAKAARDAAKEQERAARAAGKLSLIKI
jgi:multidrug resistance efflux pump